MKAAVARGVPSSWYVIRGASAGNFLVKNANICASIRAFAEKRQFDIVWLPGIEPEEANRFYQLGSRRDGVFAPEAKYYNAAREILEGGAGRFFETYPFSVEPVTDDRPFFQHHFKWRTLGQIAAMGSLGIAHLEFGYVLAVAFACAAIVLAAVGTLAPVLWLRRKSREKGLLRVVAFFLAIGLAYMGVEMSVMLLVERPSHIRSTPSRLR